MTLPLIGISTGRQENSKITSVRSPDTYIKSVIRAGGMPLMIPVGIPLEQLEQLRTELDGLLLIGGGDIDPVRFDGAPHERVYGIDCARDDLDIGLAQLAARSGWPFLGICRGIQVMNVAFGGTLYTHIADQLPNALRHDTDSAQDYSYPAHRVRLESGSTLANILGGDEHEVNSWHHQGVEKVAPGLDAMGWSPDGLVEAVQLRGHPFGLGVQWHPEWMPESQPMQALFRAFIQAAAQ